LNHQLATKPMTLAVIPILARTTLPSQVADALRELITEGALPPGQKLNERVICEHLGVSRTPLREALKLLTSEGLIALTPNRGAMVVKLELHDIEQIFELIASLEALSGELAATRASAEQIAQAVTLMHQMRAAYESQDISLYYRANHATHQLFNQMAGNQPLTAMFVQMNARIQNWRFRTNLDREKWTQAVNEHQQMIDYLVARDGHSLSLILRQHLNNKREAVMAQFKNNYSSNLIQS
jgi:DNA-binding GntR family transcriptional regulator